MLIHRMIGYPTAFVVAPLGFLAFASPRVHRGWGKAYFYLMLLLYLSGSWFTFTQHHWASWNFARNVTFNFFGFSMVLYAYRSIRLFRAAGPIKPERVDWCLAYLLTASVAAMFSVAIWKDTPMRIFTVAGIWLCVQEWRELRGGNWSKPLMYRRHLRYILVSYFYVLTVVSIVHLKDELPTKVKWLWPSALGALSIWLLSVDHRARAGALARVPHAALTKRVVLGIVGLSLLYGSYVVYDLLYGSAITLPAAA